MTTGCSTTHRYLSLCVLVSCLPRLYSFPAYKNLNSRSLFHRAPPHFGAASSDTESDTSLRRSSVAGASVSDSGFWIILGLSDDQYWPVQVTDSDEDTASATSIESLTLLQLISGVDMAGPLLPPERLAQLAILCAEQQENQSDVALQSLYQELKLPDNHVPYSELNEWQQSRVRLPQVTLDGVDMHIRGKNTQEWTLQCVSPSVDGSFEFCPRICETDSDNAIAVAFTSLALALRYHAPITTTVQDTCSSLYTLQEIQDKFPLYKSVNQLKKPANRVQSNLQRGFEIHKLTGALKVAMKKGDFKAADRIREQLDKFDSMDDLPTTKQFETSDFDSLQ